MLIWDLSDQVLEALVSCGLRAGRANGIELFSLGGPPAAFNGTDTQTFGSTTVTVTYRFEPAK